MIYISCGLNQDFVIDLLEHFDGEIHYKYESKKESSWRSALIPKISTRPSQQRSRPSRQRKSEA